MQDRADWLFAAIILAGISLGGYLGWTSRSLGRQLGRPGGTPNRLSRALLVAGVGIIAAGMVSPAIKPSLARSSAYFNAMLGTGFGFAISGTLLTVWTRPSKRQLRRMRRERERAERLARKHRVT